MSKKKNVHAVALGSLGGKARAANLTDEERRASASAAGVVGGAARAANLTPAERSKIASNAAKAKAKKARERKKKEEGSYADASLDAKQARLAEIAKKIRGI